MSYSQPLPEEALTRRAPGERDATRDATMRDGEEHDLFGSFLGGGAGGAVLGEAPKTGEEGGAVLGEAPKTGEEGGALLGVSSSSYAYGNRGKWKDLWISIKRNPYAAVVALASLILVAVGISFFASALAAFPLTIAVVAFVGVVALATLVAKLYPNAVKMADFVSILDWIGFSQWIVKHKDMAYDTFRNPAAFFGVAALAAGAGAGAYYALPLLFAVAGVSGPLALAGLVIGMVAAVVAVAYLSIKLFTFGARKIIPPVNDSDQFLDVNVLDANKSLDTALEPLKVIAPALPLADSDYYVNGEIYQKVSEAIATHNNTDKTSTFFGRMGVRIAEALPEKLAADHDPQLTSSMH